jgi:glyoxylase-like metal-dependent hydrolase (beta-lactamase superfamily II)
MCLDTFALGVILVKLSRPKAQLIRISTTRVDGGPLFGAVAKERWETFVTPDRQNRVAFGNYCMLLEHSSGLILIDTGPGDKDPADIDVAPIRSRSSMLRDLREMGIKPSDISIVVLTHLRSEHAGGGTHTTSSGRVLPTFNRAKYIVQQMAWDEACHPSERHYPFYRSADFLPLQENHQLEMVNGIHEIAKGVWVEPAPGPTSGHQMVIVDGLDTTQAFLGVLFPTPMHLCPNVATAFDWDPDETTITKKALLQRAFHENWLIGPVGKDHWIGGKQAMAASSNNPENASQLLEQATEGRANTKGIASVYS